MYLEKYFPRPAKTKGIYCHHISCAKDASEIPHLEMKGKYENENISKYEIHWKSTYTKENKKRFY